MNHSQTVQASQYGLAVLKKMRGWKAQGKGVDRIELDYHAKVDQLAISQVEGMAPRGQGCLN